MTDRISIIQLIGCRSAAGECIGLKVVHDSDLATYLSCNITTNGASYRSSILKWWSPDIEKKKFFDQLVGQTEDGGLTVLCEGTIGLQERQRNIFICMVKPIMGNPNVLKAYTRN
jgi:hypothetical protein